MACEGEPDDGCPDGQYKCPVCNGHRCKPCAQARVVVPEINDGPVADPRWCWCSAKDEGEPLLCIPQIAIPDAQQAVAWFVGQGRGSKIRVMRIDYPDEVEWGDVG